MWQDQVHGCWTNGVGQVSMSRRVPCVWFKTLLSPFKIINTFWVRDLSFSLGPSKNMDDPAHQGHSQHPWGSHPKVSTPQPVFDSFPPPFCPHWPVSPFLTPQLHWLHHLPRSGSPFGWENYSLPVSFNPGTSLSTPLSSSPELSPPMSSVFRQSLMSSPHLAVFLSLTLILTPSVFQSISVHWSIN